MFLFSFDAYACGRPGCQHNVKHCVGNSCNRISDFRSYDFSRDNTANATGVGVGLAGAEATGGSAEATGGSATVRGSGNSSNYITANPHQGQQQGQVGIVAPDIRVNPDFEGAVDVRNRFRNTNESDIDVRNRNRNSNHGVNKQGQQMGQSQSGYNSQGQSQSGHNSQGQIGVNKAVGTGNVTSLHQVYEAQERNPVSRAADVSASACSTIGASAQGANLGGAIALNNPLCDLEIAQKMALSLGTDRGAEIALELAERAADVAKAPTHWFNRQLKKLPLVGRFF